MIMRLPRFGVYQKGQGDNPMPLTGHVPFHTYLPG